MVSPHPISPTIRGNPCLWACRPAALLIPLMVTGLCFILAAYHMPDESQVLPQMEAQVQEIPPSAFVAFHSRADKPELGKLHQGQNHQKRTKLLETSLALSDEIHIKLPRSAGGRWHEKWTNEGWVKAFGKGGARVQGLASQVVVDGPAVVDDGDTTPHALVHASGTEERDKGLLRAPLGSGLQYKDSIGRRHVYFTPRRIRRKAGAFACMVDCEEGEGKVLYGEGWDYDKYRDIGMSDAEKVAWGGVSGSMLAKTLKVHLNEWKQAAEDLQDEEAEKASKETQQKLSDIVDEQKDSDEEKETDELGALKKAHSDAEGALKKSETLAKDSVEEIFLERSVADLRKQLSAAQLALKYAERGDFSYIAKLVPDGGIGNLEGMYMQEDPYLLNSVRRGDFNRTLPDDQEIQPYRDSGGNEISEHNLGAIKIQTGAGLDAIEAKAKELFDSLPTAPSSMLGDDKQKVQKGRVYVPHHQLDRLCLLCESLSGSGALSSVPACEGLSCETGAWKDSDEGWEEPDQQQEDASASTTYASSSAATRQTSSLSSGGRRAALRVDADRSTSQVNKGTEQTQTQSLVSVGRGLRRREGGDVKALPRDKVREMACHFMAHSGDGRRKELLKGMYRDKYHMPLLCTGHESGHGGQQLATASPTQEKEGGLITPQSEPTQSSGASIVQENKDASAAQVKDANAQSSEASGGNSTDAEEEDKDTNPNDEGPKSLYLYVGKDARPQFQYRMEDILSKQVMHGEPVNVETFESIKDHALRAVLWAKDCGVVMFPPFYSYPDFSAQASKDIRNYVRKGFERSGTVIFVGGDLEIKIINDIFRYQIHPRYVQGPYYKDERYAHGGTPFDNLPEMVPETGNVYGMWMASLPPNSRSFYDSFGSTVACCIRVDLGRACFLAQDFLDTLQDEIGPWATLLEAMLNYE